MTDRPFPVEALHVLTFARAIGDRSPIYAEAEVAGVESLAGVPAPPTFVMASAHTDPDYVLRPHPDEPWFGSGSEATGYGTEDVNPTADVLYAEQHFDYVRPVRVGEVLTPSTRPGRSWQKEGRRGGQLSFFETITDFCDACGETVVTSRMVGVRTERTPQPIDEGST